MRRILILFCLLSILAIAGCKKEREKFYRLPDNLEGEIYKQLSADAQFSTFVAAIDKVPGLKDELSSSGLYTVFAPTNDAFNKYFEANGKFKSLDDIPVVELTKIIKFHILKWMIFSYQFQAPGPSKNSFDLFRYETRASVVYKEYSDLKKKDVNIYYDNKNIQVYTAPFFGYYGVTPADYTSVYGNASAVSSVFNVMGASVVKTDIASGNGVIHAIDKVLVTPQNIAQELDTDPEYKDYNKILKQRFLSYAFDLSGTKSQGNNGDVNNTGVLDSLFRRVYSFLPTLDYEKGASLTAYVPTADAFNNYLNTKLLASYSSVNAVPDYTLDLLYKSHYSNVISWPSMISKGLAVNILGDKVVLPAGSVLKTKMLSNGLFYQVNTVLEPEAFLAVPGPVFFASEYSYMAQLLIQSKLYASLVSKELSLTFLAPNNVALEKAGIRPSALSTTKNPIFEIIDKGSTVARPMTLADINNWVGNNIILKALPEGGFTDGFYDTFNGSKIEIRSGKVYGADKTVTPVLSPKKQMSNGFFYGTNLAIVPPLTADTYLVQQAEYGEFYKLILQVYPTFAITGFPFIDQLLGNKYTFFVPSNTAITTAKTQGKIPVIPASTAPTYAAKIEEMKQFIRYHIVKIPAFTDGKTIGTYNSCMVDKALSSPVKEVNVAVKLGFSAGAIKVTDNKNTISSTTSPTNQITKDGVIQTIDKVLEY
ncbi:MAG: fasciclin domain-containing protein [Candidatus Pedobacter colombiensis]|uniref:Fasciclin domain-containing protein n=1 Tax=Candidatus Pedobacter colombiensis TaxID=3121371 RepID=A0AAJ5WAA0_9SPHI|nr:fasciclin domain-containing protein [Pedobacter sp.]WEK19961.1 MAG: fasciclin domain-containing protein [Pedobacter sp.]